MAELASVKMELDEQSKQLIWEVSKLSRRKPGWLDFAFLSLMLGVSMLIHVSANRETKTLEAKLSDQAEVITTMNNRLLKLEQSR